VLGLAGRTIAFDYLLETARFRHQLTPWLGLVGEPFTIEARAWRFKVCELDFAFEGSTPTAKYNVVPKPSKQAFLLTHPLSTPF
jgi:hypothetical protein